MTTLTESEPTQPDIPQQISATEADFNTRQRSFAFWAVIVGLGVTLWLAALENSVLTTAAPAVLKEIPLGDDWVWLTNAFFLSSAAFQPLLGQLADLFGRRWLTMCVVALFMLGSGICGGATNGAMLIAGRAVQGVGSGGVLLAYDIIVADMVPLRYRGNYIAIILLIYSVGTTMGAFIGGLIVSHTTWRWIFYINLPLGAVSFLIMFCFLHVNHRRDTSWISRLKRIDIVGNLILIAGTVSMLLSLTYAGIRHSWSSWRTLVPLLLGFVCFVLFGLYEASRFAPLEPVMAPRLFNNRTSIIIGINTFLFTTVVYWVIFFLPVYFQAVQLVSPTRAGINVIPVAILGVPAAAASAAAVARWGKYKAIHLIGFALFTIGMGLLSLLDENSPVGMWLGFDFIGPIGGGLLLNTQLLAFQAPVSEVDQAMATGTWNFIRTLGGVWGVAIPAAIFANHVDSLVASGAISSPIAASYLSDGGAYEYASAEFVNLFPDPIRTEVRAVYGLSIQRVFVLGVAFSGFAFLLCLFEKDIPLRTVLITEYGLKEDGRNDTEAEKEHKNVIETGGV